MAADGGHHCGGREWGLSGLVGRAGCIGLCTRSRSKRLQFRRPRRPRARNRVHVGGWGTGEWVQRGQGLDGTAGGDRFGTRVGVSGDGNVVAISAPQNGGGGSSTGQVHVFEWSSSGGGMWVQVGSALAGDASNQHFGDGGLALSADGGILAVGSSLRDVAGTDSGDVCMYERDGSGWVALGTPIAGAAAGDHSGYAVAVSASGRVVAVSSDRSNSVGTNSGAVSVFVWSGGDWVQRGAVIGGELAGDRFGFAVSLNSGGSVLAVGAQFAHFTAAAGSGHVRVFDLTADDSSASDAACASAYGNSGSLYVGSGGVCDGTREEDVCVVCAGGEYWDWGRTSVAACALGPLQSAG